MFGQQSGPFKKNTGEKQTEKIRLKACLELNFTCGPSVSTVKQNRLLAARPVRSAAELEIRQTRPDRS
jgi:hypothetical protein